ncbi:MAG TPA: CBS domain-containing protein [Trueperaceae bacterium]|nr:CBS domain-containing protein [Trueperaceae bacterium]
MQARRTVRQLVQDKGAAVYTVSPDTSVFGALEVMAERDVGALVVVDDGGVAGVFSERDYARKVILLGRGSRDLPVRDVMTRDVVTVTPEQTVADCMQLMTQHRIRHLPVLAEGRLAGIVSIGDVVKAVMSEQEFLIEQLQEYISGSVR